MNSKKIYLIWLQLVFGIGSKKVKEFLDFYNGDVESLYKDGERGWRLCGLLDNKNIDKLKNEEILNLAKKAFEKANSLDYKILTFYDDKYPQKLKTIYNPPMVLYVSGDLGNIDDEVSISIVGTRSSTKSGLDIAANFAYDLAKNGCIIVSGGAMGIDSAAHKGAIQAGGKTISVLGCGINYPYLPSLASMRNTISKTGALVSEYPPDVPPQKWTFPVRNRIISGLSNGVLIVEAGVKSGSLITAEHAIDQNRDVFAVPGSIQSPTSNGTNKLIKDGAKPVTCVEDILDEYNHVLGYNISKNNNNTNNQEILNKLPLTSTIQSKELKNGGSHSKKLPDGISEDAKRVYNMLSKEPKHIDEIAIKCSIKPNVVLQALTELELAGVVDSLSGRRYIKS